MTTYARGVCQHDGRTVELISHPDDPPPAMWVHADTRRASCDLFAEPVRPGDAVGDGITVVTARLGEFYTELGPPPGWAGRKDGER